MFVYSCVIVTVAIIVHFRCCLCFEAYFASLLQKVLHGVVIMTSLPEATQGHSHFSVLAAITLPISQIIAMPVGEIICVAITEIVHRARLITQL